MMASKEDLKGMARKEDFQDMKELMKDIKHRFIPHVSTQEEDKEENENLFQSRLEKIENKLESRKLESIKKEGSTPFTTFSYFLSCMIYAWIRSLNFGI